MVGNGCIMVCDYRRPNDAFTTLKWILLTLNLCPFLGFTCYAEFS